MNLTRSIGGFFVLVVALIFSGCTSRATALLDASLWAVPYTIESGEEGLHFRLPEALTYQGGGDTDSSSSGWVTEKKEDGMGDEYFTVTSFTLHKCENGESCSLTELVAATPQEVIENLVKDYSEQDHCAFQEEIAVGNVKAQLFNCMFPDEDVVFFYGSKGAYRVANKLPLLLGDAELSDALFKNFLQTFDVE